MGAALSVDRILAKPAPGQTVLMRRVPRHSYMLGLRLRGCALHRDTFGKKKLHRRLVQERFAVVVGQQKRVACALDQGHFSERLKVGGFEF